MLDINMLSEIIHQDGESSASSKARASKWLPGVLKAFEYAQLDTEQRQIMFLATIALESSGLCRLVENLNYSAQGLANTWPSRYSKNPKGNPKVPNALAIKLARKPVAIANNVYANRMGNSFESSMDGWNFRGRGPGQLTGRANFEACEKAIKYPIVKQSDLLELPIPGMLSCAWHWKMSNCNTKADAGDFQGVSKIWNGGLIGFDDFDRHDKDSRMDYYIVATGVYHQALNKNERTV